ncbi:hypothetical protein GDO86_007734 [Hymenochirus boettgeri]|uniref:Tissue factor n=1 Tax=Hymenochirus boettgeri TaxID=247094 RepID=A0A8T2IZ39_9PIPI|nr:hypothetical protein GDO86_007734 [Hymenochirus boettgeri]
MWALNILTSLLLMGCSICWHRTAATGTETLNIPIAENITWSSLNLKTLLEWQPKPENYRYTVEVAAEGENWKKKCINTLATECDVTDLLENVKGTYHARVISQPLDTEEYTEEYPYSTSNSFSPYQQSIIGKPGFESYDFNADSTKLKVIIKDPLTPYRFPNGSFKSIRDVFKDDLRYTLNYRKSSSTGKVSKHAFRLQIKAAYLACNSCFAFVRLIRIIELRISYTKPNIFEIQL